MFSRIKKIWSMRSSSKYLDYLRHSGMKIGEGTIIFAKPYEVLIDTTRPWLVNIGNNVQITSGVKILTHGYDWATLKAVYGDICGSAGKVEIGDNCFIGMNSIILKGSKIGKNSIVGAGSVLTGKEYPEESVIAGNPAKVVCSLSQYYEKRLNTQVKEAKELVCEYFKTYGTIPDKSLLSEFFWLFEERKGAIEDVFVSQMKNMNNYDLSEKVFLNSEPLFNGYDAFIDFCLNEN